MAGDAPTMLSMRGGFSPSRARAARFSSTSRVRSSARDTVSVSSPTLNGFET